MGRFVNDRTGVVVSVDDSKDERFTSGWTAEKAPAASDAEKAEPAKAEPDKSKK